MQEEMETAPVVVENVPAIQGTQVSAVEAPDEEEYVPATQETQADSD